MLKIVFVYVGSCILLSCATNNNHTTVPPTNDTTGGAPVETKSPNTNYPPAFAGQTRISSTKTNTAFSGKVIATGLSRPWAVTSLPDGRLLITQKGGTMRIANAEGVLSAAITGLPAVNSAGQGGLLDVLVDPQFATNRMLYWTFSEGTPDGNLTAVAKGTLSADEQRIENASIIYRALPAYRGALHYGSRILMDATGNLLVSTGERSDLETRPQAQMLNSANGKIVRITKDGQPAAGNPFVGQANARPEIYSYGHRNTQGLAIHPETGDLWNSEMGPRGGDEINRVQAGKNYGWPAITYGIEYGGGKIGTTQQAGMEQPVYYWDPVLSPSGMVFYKGYAIPEWNNNLFIAGLNSNHIARIILRDNKVVGEERLLANEGQRFRDVAMGNDGYLYAVTDEGRLYKIGK